MASRRLHRFADRDNCAQVQRNRGHRRSLQRGRAHRHCMAAGDHDREPRRSHRVQQPAPHLADPPRRRARRRSPQLQRDQSGRRSEHHQRSVADPVVRGDSAVRRRVQLRGGAARRTRRSRSSSTRSARSIRSSRPTRRRRVSRSARRTRSTGSTITTSRRPRKSSRRCASSASGSTIRRRKQMPRDREGRVAPLEVHGDLPVGEGERSHDPHRVEPAPPGGRLSDRDHPLDRSPALLRGAARRSHRR